MRTRLMAMLIVAVLGAILAVSGALGNAVFAQAEPDALDPADAIVVLGGEHDGREQYGIDLARRGLASTVLISNPYGPHDEVMREVCATEVPGVEVICFEPDPATTRGEAQFVQRLSTERGWRHVIAISWRYHLPRVRHVFGQCFDGTVAAVDPPRDYQFSAAQWAFVDVYQVAGFAKAAVLGCS